jgi:hypothetical protein
MRIKPDSVTKLLRSALKSLRSVTQFRRSLDCRLLKEKKEVNMRKIRNLGSERLEKARRRANGRIFASDIRWPHIACRTRRLTVFEPRGGGVIRNLFRGMQDSRIQHKQTHVAPSGFGFDDAGERVPVVEPQVLGEEAETDDARADSMQTIMRFIKLVVTDASPLKTGQRVHLFAHLCGLTDYKTDAEFARKLNVSPGRVSQIREELPSELRVFGLLKSRTAKARPFSVGSSKLKLKI